MVIQADNYIIETRGTLNDNRVLKIQPFQPGNQISAQSCGGLFAIAFMNVSNEVETVSWNNP